MIEIIDKKNCCGCRACDVRCPKSCISMTQDSEGFVYPLVDKDICIDCGLCEKVCPVINQSQSTKPLEVYAVVNPDEKIRMESSSGGIFTPLAKSIIDETGVVFGVSWDENWLAEHTFIENAEDLKKFRGSKYLQSNTNNSYAQAEGFLKSGRNVLFSGTPCQIAGLKKFLIKEYDNLLCVEVVCHGVPSPMIWQKYLTHLRITNKTVAENNIADISFRDKVIGWKHYSLSLFTEQNGIVQRIFSETPNKNIYMQGFLRDLYLRPSCYNCPARSGKSGADISIADYWGVDRYHKNIDDDKGVGLVLIYTTKGKTAYDGLTLRNIPSTMEYALKGNPCIEHSVKEPKLRTEFWEQYESIGIRAIDKICAKMKPSLFIRVKRKAKSIIGKIIKK